MPLTKEQQFEAMIGPFVRGLFQTASHLTADRSIAEEILHEVYVTAWKSFRLEGEEVDWRVEVFRLLIRGARRRNRELMGMIRSIAPTVNASSEVVTELLAGLPESCREAILLVDSQGLTYNEASRVLGLSIEVFSETLRRGRDLMNAKSGAFAPTTPTGPAKPQSDYGVSLGLPCLPEQPRHPRRSF